MCPAAAPAAFSPCALGGPRGERGGVLRDAGELDAGQGRWRSSQTTPARVKIPASTLSEPLVEGRRDEPCAGMDHLLSVCRPADARHPVGAEAGAEQDRRGRAVRRHEAFRERHDRGAAGARPTRALDRGGEPVRGDREEHVVGALDAVRDRLDAQRRRQLDARQILRSCGAPRASGLRLRACLEGRAHRRTGKQDRDAVPNDPAPITIARRVPGSDAWARVSPAGRPVGRPRGRSPCSRLRA